MKNKKILFIGIFSLSIFLGFLPNISLVNGYIGTYEKRTDPLNPFIFIVDILYYNEEIAIHEVESLYHKVFLQEGKDYLLFIDSGLVDNAHVIVYYSADFWSDHFSDLPDYPITYVLFFRPSQTGFYTLYLELGLEGADSFCSIQIGFLEVPTINLNEVIDWQYWDFKWNSIIAAKMDLEEGYYEVEVIGTLVDYILYNNFDLISHHYQLSEDTSNCFEPDTKTFFSSGEYIFFSLTPVVSFKINKYITPKQDSINPFVIGLIIAIPIVISIPIGLFLYKRYKKRKDA